MEEITSKAVMFRAAIVETLEAGMLPETMLTFPRGCCGDASLLLGTYLKEVGLGNFTYVCGERGCQADGNWASHAWLVQGSLIVDITKSQFPDCPDEITASYDSHWHNSFRVTDTFNADIRGTGDQLEPYYEVIIGTIKKS